LHPNSFATTVWAVEGPWTYSKNTERLTLSVSNMKGFNHYPVPDQETGRRLEAMAPVERDGKAKVYLFIEDVSEHSMKVRIVRVQLFDHFDHFDHVTGDF